MKIFNASQIKGWDEATIINEPVAPIELMERAAIVCCNWLLKQKYSTSHIRIFCGRGNNGGDGLAIARILLSDKWEVSTYILAGETGSENFETNLKRLKHKSAKVYELQSPQDFPLMDPGDVIIDALFGTGLNRTLEGLPAHLTDFLNNQGSLIIAIDIPSGLFTDSASSGSIIRSTYTLTFQATKLCFMVAENAPYFGKVKVLPIGLDKEFAIKEDSDYELLESSTTRKIFKPKQAFSHKGNFGFAGIIAGSYGMMGAAVLATKACLRSGVGKVSCITCKKGYQILQVTAPEAMCTTSGSRWIKKLPDLAAFTALGVGPGIGLHDSHKELLSELFETFEKPLVLDADALNVLSEHPKLISRIPVNTILTPHPKEFDKLFGESANDFDRLHKAIDKAHAHSIYIILKGHHTLIATPNRKGYFNSTGNAGMAKGGSGDVLTGILTGLLAQGYDYLEACKLAVYIHGLSGDLAARKFSQESMIAGDLINQFGYAFSDFQ